MPKQKDIKKIIKNNPNIDEELFEKEQEEIEKLGLRKQRNKYGDYNIEPPFSRRFIKLPKDNTEDPRTVYLKY